MQKAINKRDGYVLISFCSSGHKAIRQVSFHLKCIHKILMFRPRDSGAEPLLSGKVDNIIDSNLLHRE